jgi:DNA-binding transcriptional ArsR family regulator
MPEGEDFHEMQEPFLNSIGDMVGLFKAMGNSNRLRILFLLLRGPLTFRRLREEIFGGGRYIWQEWLPTSKKYEESFPFFIETYEEGRFYGLESKESEIDCWIPIKLKKKGKSGKSLKNCGGVTDEFKKQPTTKRYTDNPTHGKGREARQEY